MPKFCENTPSAIPRPNLTRIPGELPKSKPERYVEDLSKLTKQQLFEIKEREEKLLANTSRISKLPDKGQRIKDFYAKVLKEIEMRDEVEQAAILFSDLNIASKGTHKLINMEWNGKYDPNADNETMLDSDDEDEKDPLKIIAGSRSEKTIKIIKPEKSLITEEDLKEIESFKSKIQDDLEDSAATVEAELVDIDISTKVPDIKLKLKEKFELNGTNLNGSNTNSNTSLDLEPHALYLMDKVVDTMPQNEKFKPYKTTKSNVHDPEKEKSRKKPLGKYWEITAATPPPIQHTQVQMIPLQDSVEIQMQYLEKLKELQEKQAEERLKARAARKTELGSVIVPDESIFKLSQFFGGYRSTIPDDEEEDVGFPENQTNKELHIHSDDEVYDDVDEKCGGTVTFPIMN